MRKVQYFMNDPIKVQNDILDYLIVSAKKTEWGEKYHYNTIKNHKDFAKQVPVNKYDELFPYIERMMYGEKDILWPGDCIWFSKSSGTTADKSKYIPVTSDILKNGHVKSSWDVVTFLYNNFPDSTIFKNKNLVLGGSLERFKPYPKTRYGDVSAIMLYNMPKIGRPFYAPDFDTALMPNWDEKLDKIARIASKENISMFGGVPSWTLLLMRKIIEITGKNNMLEVWPNARVYIHGGVNFKPYKSQFDTLFPSKKFRYMETYNASEGYFGIQNDMDSDDMILLLDNGVYYEFCHMIGDNKGVTIPLSKVKLNTNYAMIISTTGGLWRYEIGDTIIFTSLRPYKFKITGRTKQYINVFGEEVMVSNTDDAVSQACKVLNCSISEYTVGPIFIEEDHSGGHEWVIEFHSVPADIEKFAQILDKKLQDLNSDYEAKRYKNLALLPLIIKTVPKGTFYKWMESINKLGGQNKIPRLSNDRKYINQLLNINSTGVK